MKKHLKVELFDGVKYETSFKGDCNLKYHGDLTIFVLEGGKRSIGFNNDLIKMFAIVED